MDEAQLPFRMVICVLTCGGTSNVGDHPIFKSGDKKFIPGYLFYHPFTFVNVLSRHKNKVASPRNIKITTLNMDNKYSIN